MRHHAATLVDRLWAVLENPKAVADRRFAAACALASYDSRMGKPHFRRAQGLAVT
jgi:hypothetical protein